MMTREKFEKRFIPEPMSGCFLWEGSQNSQGYGCIFSRGKHILAHRASYQIYCGEIPEGIKVLHHCDNPCCVNPDHLFLGTQSDNMKDCAKKNRSNKAGEINGNAKLSADDVRFIRAQPRKPFVCHELAEKFGVAHLTIRHIRGDRRKWKSV